MRRQFCSCICSHVAAMSLLRCSNGEPRYARAARSMTDADRAPGRRASGGAGAARAPTASGRFETRAARGVRRRLGEPGRARAVQDRGAARDGQEHHRHATTAPTSASTSRSTPIAAASTAASTATRGRRTAYLGHSPGLDFETKLYAKANAAELLERELANPRYVPKVDRARRRHRPLPADRARAPHHALGAGGAGAHQPSGRHRHQVGAGRARHRHPRAHGGARPRQGGDLGDDARPHDRAQDGAAGRDAARAARGDPAR